MTSPASTLKCAAANPWEAYSARIVAITPEIADVATYHLQFAPRNSSQLEVYRPGQFNMLYLPGVGESAISVSGYDADRKVWLHTVRQAGNVTRSLAKQRVGGSLLVRGPFGSSWPLEECGEEPMVIVAGGIGLAPLRDAIDSLLERRPRSSTTTLIYGARSPDLLLYQQQYSDWQRRGLNLYVTVDHAPLSWNGCIGVVTIVLDRVLAQFSHPPRVLSCGPEVMMRYVARTALQRGVPAERIWLSLERNMQCAVGFCGHCQLGPAFICKDGPVLRYDVIAPYLDVEQM